MKIVAIKQLGKVGDKVIGAFAVCVLLIIFVSNVVITSHVSYDGNEIVTYSHSAWYLLILPIELVAFLMMIRWMKHVNEKKLFVILAILHLGAAAILILCTDNFLRADPALVYDAARQFLMGDFSPLEKQNYMGEYPHQLGLAIYDMVLLKIHGSEKIFYGMNALEVLVINWYGYRITEKCFESSNTNKTVIFLEFLFLPQFFFILFAYGTIPGFCCFVIAVYHAVCLYRDESYWKHGCLLVLFSALAILLKKNYIIGILAIGIMLMLKFVKEVKKPQVAALVLVVVLISFILPNVLKNIFSSISEVKIGNGSPSSAWIAMGTDIDNEVRGPGWFNNYNREVYRQSEYDTELANDAAWNKIRENLKKSVNRPQRTIEFYTKKIVSMWCEPMFQSVWSGPGVGEGYVHTQFLRSLYSGGSVEKLCNLFNKCLVMITLASALVFRVSQKIKLNRIVQVLYLYLIGGFLFHIFWEAKSQYVYTYVFLLLPLCAYELCELQKWLQSRLKF